MLALTLFLNCGCDYAGDVAACDGGDERLEVAAGVLKVRGLFGSE